MTDNHEGMTRMLFVDAVVGVGFPAQNLGMAAEQQELATFTGNQHNEEWSWTRTALEKLTTPDLQDLYTYLKTYEVTHAG